MTIKRTLGNLPPARDERAWAPDSEVRFAQALVEQWQAENRAVGERPHAIEGTRFRHSDAGKCARLIAYKAAGIAATDPMDDDLCGIWNTRLGEWVHDQFQQALAHVYPGLQAEIVSQVFDEGSGSMDVLLTLTGVDGGFLDRIISIEIKTIGGYGFKSAIGKIRRGTPPEGPRPEHVVQGALNALAHEADELVILYLAKETLSKGYSEVPDVQKFAAEWTLTREQYEPYALAEIERVQGILSLLDEDKLAARKVPGVKGEIVDPATSRWEREELVTLNGETTPMVVDTGTVWSGQYCLYCSHLTLCQGLPSGRIPVESAVELRGAL